MADTELLGVMTDKNQNNKFDSQEKIRNTYTPEIVIALCGPMGTPLHEVAATFKKILESHDFGYEQVNVIRLSEIIRKLKGLKESEVSLDDLISAGNELREQSGNAILVQHAIREIYLARQKTGTGETGSDDVPKIEPGAVIPTKVTKVCHIINSIKNNDELTMLRQVYGDMLHVFGVYAPIELRIERLNKQYESSDIYNLIDRDSGEEIKHGQTVRDTFPRADFFLRADTGTDTQLTSRVQRFLDLMMGVRIITPTIAERAMYEAYSAARNSACLSRQVGAAVIDSTGNLLGVGWNDVPKAFGGLYETPDYSASMDSDHRCWNKDGGKCFNDEEKDFLAKQMTDRLFEKKLIKDEAKEKIYDALRHDSKLKDLIEFSRAIHAEMHALLNASQTSGAKLKNGKLYVTTYPCHSCARHIVAAGIAEVYFLEPYRKSLATKLHADSITESETDTTKVRIMPFDGVAPSRFLKLFSASDIGRKNNAGRINTQTVQPVTAITVEAIQTLESLAFKGIS